MFNLAAALIECANEEQGSLVRFLWAEGVKAKKM